MAYGQKRRQKREPSRQDRWIGYAVLGFGLLAVLGVGWLAFSRYGATPQTAPPVAEEQAVVKAGPARKLSAAKIEGVWETAFLDYNCTLDLRDDGTFRILATRPVQALPRYYSRGRYTLDGAFITLTPDKAMGTPEAEDPDHKYRPLTLRAYAVELRLKDGQQIWFPGPIDQDFPNRNPAHPLIQFSGNDSLVWARKQ